MYYIIFELSLQILVCILYLLHIFILASCISSSRFLHVTRGYQVWQCRPQVLIYSLSPCSWWNDTLRMVLAPPCGGGHACLLRHCWKIIICPTWLPGFVHEEWRPVALKAFCFIISWFLLISFYSEVSFPSFLAHFRDGSCLCFPWHVRMEIIYQKWRFCWCSFWNSFCLLLWFVCLCMCEYSTCVWWHRCEKTDFQSHFFTSIVWSEAWL